MRKGWKIGVLIAAACCALTATAVIGAGRTTSSEAHSVAVTESFRYSDIPKYEGKVGFKVVHCENLGNGYSFDSVNYNEGEDYDESGIQTASFKGLDICYKNKDGSSIILSTYKDANTSFDLENAQETKEVDGVQLYYFTDTYLFLPPNESPSEEEQQRADTDPHFFISYGSDRKESQQMSDCVFSKDGISYLLMSTGKAIPANEMFGFAETLLG